MNLLENDDLSLPPVVAPLHERVSGNASDDLALINQLLEGMDVQILSVIDFE